MVADGWGPVDQTAERLFRRTDSGGSGFLSVDQFKAVEPKLNQSIRELARRGALDGLPPNALNAKSFGLMLPGAKEISRPEFVLEARARASKLLRRMTPALGMPGPGMPGPGMPQPRMYPDRPQPKSPSHRQRGRGPQPSVTAINRLSDMLT
jgi:hypothetical protein